jgi:hypothetical protein
MATTKANTELHSSTTLTAGAGDTTSSSVNLIDGYGAGAFIRLTNGGTGPTVPAQVQVEVSFDDSSWIDFGGPLVGTSTNSDVIEWYVPIDKSVRYVRFVSGSNTAQDVTLDIDVTETTKI